MSTALENFSAQNLFGHTIEEHYARNQFQNQGAPDSLNDLISRYDTIEEFNKHWVQEKHPYCHNLYGAEGNVSYRGIGDQKGKQYVFDEDGDRVTDAANGGTWDFASPNEDGKMSHFFQDVLPWVVWGNSPEDFAGHGYAGINERAKALERTIKAGAVDYAGESIYPISQEIVSSIENLAQAAGEAADYVEESARELGNDVADQITLMGDSFADQAERVHSHFVASQAAC